MKVEGGCSGEKSKTANTDLVTKRHSRSQHVPIQRSRFIFVKVSFKLGETDLLVEKWVEPEQPAA